MEIEKIISQLKEGLKNSSLSDRTIKSKAERLAKKITDENSAELIADAIDDLKELNGQLNKDVADKAKELEEKLKGTFTPQTPTPPKPTGDESLMELTKRLEQMEKNFQEKLKNERMIAIRKEAAQVLKEKHNTKSDYILGNVMAKVEVADADTAETLAQKAIPLYDTEYKLAYGDNSVPRSADGTPPEGKAQIDAMFAKKMPKKN